MEYEDEGLTEEELILRGIEIEDGSADMQRIFTKLGFENVRLTEYIGEKIPRHVLEFASECRTDEEIEELRSMELGPRYFLVETNLGNFGLFYDQYWFVDLMDSSVRLEDVMTSRDGISLEYQLFPLGQGDTLQKFIIKLHMDDDFRRAVEEYSAEGGE